MSLEGEQKGPVRPDLSLRAPPPSPRRLSRKVLMSGAIIAASIIALSLYLGLSQTHRRAQTPSEGQVAAGAVPDSIANAPSHYGAADLPRATLTPPEDPFWGSPAPIEGPHEATAAPAPGAVRSGAGGASPEASPGELARASPIMFARDAAHAPESQEGRLTERLTPPRSRYEVQAGSVIPAALITELNSDRPGRVIAQVTQNVFDTVTGAHLLIPQGARLIGTYDSAIGYGDRRLAIVWTRLILPNGWSINLRGMEASDVSGASGLRDRTDNHLGRLAGAVALSAIVSVIAENAEDNNDELSLGQSVGEAAAAQAAQTGSHIVERELEVRPTLRIRAGGAVRVLVTRDIELRPYRGPER